MTPVTRPAHAPKDPARARNRPRIRAAHRLRPATSVAITAAVATFAAVAALFAVDIAIDVDAPHPAAPFRARISHAQAVARLHLPLVGVFEAQQATWSGDTARTGGWTHLSATDRVRVVAADPDGRRVWAGTYGGLVSWDLRTERMERHTLEPTSHVAIDGDGGVWVIGCPAASGTPIVADPVDVTSTVARRAPDGRWTCFEKDVVHVMDVVSGMSGDVFAWSWTDGLFRWSDGNWTRIEEPPKEDGGEEGDDGTGPLNFMSPDGRGGLWATLGNNGRPNQRMVHVDGDGEWSDAAWDFEDAWIRDLAVDARGAPWVSLHDLGVLRWEDGAWAQVANERLADWSIRELVSDEEGAMWLFGSRELLHNEPPELWRETSAGILRVLPSGVVETVREVHPQSAFQRGLPEELQSYSRCAASTFGSIGGVLLCGDIPRGAGLAHVRTDGTWRGYGGTSPPLPDEISNVLADPSRAELLVVGHGSGVQEIGPQGTWTRSTWRTGRIDRQPVVVDQDGGVWVGHLNALWRREADGLTRHLRAREGLPDAPILSLAAAPDGALWIGTYGGGVARMRGNGDVQRFGTTDGLGGDRVEAIVFGPDGRTWLGTTPTYRPHDPARGGPLVAHGGGVTFGDPERGWQVIDHRHGLPHDEVFALAVDAQGTAWIGTKAGLVRRGADGGLRSVLGGTGVVTGHIWALALNFEDANAPDECGDLEGAVWVGGEGGLALVSAAGALVAEWPAAELPAGGPVRALVARPDGTLWLATDRGGAPGATPPGGVIRLDSDGAMKAYSWPPSLATSPGAIGMAVARGGRLWVTTGRGVVRLDPHGGFGEPFVTQNALLDADARAMLRDPDGTLWLATAEGIGVRKPDEDWRILYLGDGLPGPEVYAAVRGADGARYFGVGEGTGSSGRFVGTGGLVRVDDAGRATPVLVDELGGFDVRALAAEPDGGLWLSLAQRNPRGRPSLRWVGLTHVDADGTARPLRPSEGSATLSATGLHRDAAGTLYVVHDIADEAGVSVRSPEGLWTTLTTADGLPSNRVRDVALDGWGGVLFATEAGVAYRDARGEWSVHRAGDGLDGPGFDNVGSVAVDGLGRAWFGSFGHVAHGWTPAAIAQWRLPRLQR